MDAQIQTFRNENAGITPPPSPAPLAYRGCQRRVSKHNGSHDAPCLAITPAAKARCTSAYGLRSNRCRGRFRWRGRVLEDVHCVDAAADLLRSAAAGHGTRLGNPVLFVVGAGIPAEALSVQVVDGRAERRAGCKHVASLCACSWLLFFAVHDAMISCNLIYMFMSSNLNYPRFLGF